MLGSLSVLTPVVLISGFLSMPRNDLSGWPVNTKPTGASSLRTYRNPSVGADLLQSFSSAGELIPQLREGAMFRTISKTLLRAGFALTVFCSWPPGASIGQTVPVCPAATVALTPNAVEPVCPAVSGTTPPTVTAGQKVTLTLCTNGAVDLGNLTTGQFGIKPSQFASNYQILNQFATAMVFSVDIASSAKTGRWTVFANDSSGHEAIALDIFINPATSPPPGECPPAHAKCPPACPKGQICLPGPHGVGCCQPSE